MPRPSTPTRERRFRRRLLAWYRKAARDLPWRRTRDPYAILVSEFMLQQTQVARVLDFYEPFLRRYPSIHSLARARPLAVREAWEGLGYYRRAANLHRLAQEVIKRHDGVVPADVPSLRELPGVGAYTAGAVACFAYETPAATVDTNVARVLGRVFQRRVRRRAPGRDRSRARVLFALAESLLPRRGRTAYDFNQALMELGALVCTARSPKCPACPVRACCDWYGARKPGAVSR
jgi:A/G-specific adenine glycosylase